MNKARLRHRFEAGFAVLYRTAVLHAAVALAAPRLRLQEAARGIDEGAGGGQKVALFLVDHAQRVDKVGESRSKKSSSPRFGALWTAVSLTKQKP